MEEIPAQPQLPARPPFRSASGPAYEQRRRPARRPARRWPRRLLIAANVAVAVCLLSAGLVWAYIHYRIDSIHTVAAPHLTADSGGDGENILLIGNETRAGLTNPAEIAQLGS